MRASLYLLPLAAALLALSAGDPVSDPCAHCAHNSKCVNNACVCEDGFDGDGTLLCYRKADHHVCRIRSDPEMQTFAGENALVETFGSTNFAELSTGRRTGVGENGMCRFSSTAWTERVLGKIFTKGVTFELTQEDILGQSIYLEVAVRAEVVDGRYRYAVSTRQSKEGLLEHEAYISPTPYPGETESITIPRADCDIVFRLMQGKVLSVNLACCGIRLGLRPFHAGYKEAIPGLYIMVKKVFLPRFPMWEPMMQPLCLVPDRSIYSINDLKKQTGLSDLRNAMSFQALTNPGRHVDTTPDDQHILAGVLKNCPAQRLQMFWDEAGVLKDSPPFINCVSGNSKGQHFVMSLLLHSARYYCYGWRWACLCSKQLVMDRCGELLKRPARYPRVAAFVRQDCNAL